MAFDIHVHTQYLENYGTDQNPYWKGKGGSTYVLTNFNAPLNAEIGKAAQSAIDSVRSQIECFNSLCREYIIDWEFMPAGSPTPWERDQQEFDGRIDSPSRRIALSEVRV